MIGFIVMGILAALDAASGGTPGTPGQTPMPLAPLSSPLTVQLGGPGTSLALQGTSFVYTSTPKQVLDSVNKAAAAVLNSPDQKTATIQAGGLAGIATITVQSASSAKQSGIFGATGDSGTVTIKAAGSGSSKSYL